MSKVFPAELFIDGSKDFIVAFTSLNTGVIFDMINFENVLRSIPGYIMDPAGTYEKNRNTVSFFTLAILLILDAVVSLISGFAFEIFNILNGYSNGPQLLLPSMTLFILARYVIEILIITFVIHFASRYENRKAKLVDSFKISIVSYTYYIITLAIFNQINVFYVAGMNYNAVSLTHSIGYPAFFLAYLILAFLLFIRVSAEGIKVVYGLSRMKSYAIAIISIATAKIILYLTSSLIGDFCLFIAL